MKGEAKILETLHLLYSCAVQHKVSSMTMPSIRGHPLCFAQIECELTLITEACQRTHLLLMPTTAAGPAAVVGIKLRSSAYSNSGTRVPLREGASLSAVSSRCLSSPSTYTPNSVGLSGHPCLTPIRHLKMAQNHYNDRSAALLRVYRDLMSPGHQVATTPATAHHEIQFQNAILKSPKQQYIMPDWKFCCRLLLFVYQ